VTRFGEKVAAVYHGTAVIDSDTVILASYYYYY